MIVALVADVSTKLDLEGRLRTTLSEIKSIEATHRALEQIATSARDLALAVRVCEPHLGALTVAPILDQMAGVAQDLDASRQRFATNRKENVALYNPGVKLQRAATDLAERWQRHAQLRLMPYLELLRLVNYLPEAAAGSFEIDQLVKQIKTQIASPPRSQAQLDQFHQRLSELGGRLDAVARLPEEVRTFLSKVVDGTATIADLTSDVRAWIAADDRADAFSISFAQRRS